MVVFFPLLFALCLKVTSDEELLGSMSIFLGNIYVGGGHDSHLHIFNPLKDDTVQKTVLCTFQKN